MPPAPRPRTQFPTTHPGQPLAPSVNHLLLPLDPPSSARLTNIHKDDQATICGSCIIVIAPMRLEKLRQVDLNLLITFAAIAEEKSVTAAASRLLLSQPAVSRALQRARV